MYSVRDSKIEMEKGVKKRFGFSKKIILRFGLLSLIIGLLLFSAYKIYDVHCKNKVAPISSFSDINSSKVSRLTETEREALLSFACERLCGTPSPSDFLEFGYRLRLYRRLLESYERSYPEHPQLYLEAMSQEPKVNQHFNQRLMPSVIKEQVNSVMIPYPSSPLLWDMERNLFPWLKKRHHCVLELKNKFDGKGIIIPSGSGLLKYAIHLIKCIRYFNCTLPIVVTYYGKKDIKAEELRYLDSVLKVETIDISREFNTSEIDPKGWAIKPFSLLAAPFEEVIMMDADVVILQNPEILFQDEGYLEHGVIIFHDRTLFGNKDKRKWLESNLPNPLSDRVKTNRMFQGISAHEQESCVIVWNRKKRMYGLLAACKMNSKAERDAVTYKEFYGDKETFWIGLEMANQSYTDLQPRPGVIGFLKYDEHKKQDVVCGRILQFDRDGNPLLFNGAIVKDRRKKEHQDVIMNLTYYAREGEWDWGDSSLDRDVTPISDNMRKVIQDLASLYAPKINYTDIHEA